MDSISKSAIRIPKSSSVILIHPPVVKPSEPPPGIARLCGALHHHGVSYQVVDANVEGILELLRSPMAMSDTWTRRAERHVSKHLALLTTWDGYRRYDSYQRAVHDLNRLLEMAGYSKGVWINLGNYEHKELRPTRSEDLLKAAEHPESDPFHSYFSKRFRELIEVNRPSIVGFSLNYLSQALSTFAMVGFLRKEYPALTLILGGGLLTSWVRRPGWSNPFTGLVDHVVAGHGEKILMSIMGVNVEADGGQVNPHWIPNYDALPLHSYLAPGPILPYSASSGCYWNQCSFCPEKAEGNPYVPVPMEKVTSDLHQLVNKHKPVLIHLTDNAISPALLNVISSNPPCAPWYGFVRFTHHLTDLDFCLALKRSGCVMLKLGLESGDQRVLEAMQKGIDLGEASLALKTLKQAGIATYVYLLFGTPPESLEEARATRDFVARHHDEIGFLNVAIFNLPVYGPDTVNLETKMFYEGDLSLYVDFEHPKGWNRKQVRQFLDKEFKRHPAIAPILRRDPPVFTSNHAPFFVMT